MSELRVQLHVPHDDGLSPVPLGEDAEAVVENDGGGGVGVEQRGVAAEERAVHTAEIAGDVLVDAALLEREINKKRKKSTWANQRKAFNTRRNVCG